MNGDTGADDGGRMISRRAAVTASIWSSPVIVMASAVSAVAASIPLPTTTTISVTSAHDYRTGQTAGSAPSATTAATGSGGASRAKDTPTSSTSLYITLRITNTGLIPLTTGFTTTFSFKGAVTIASSSLDAAVRPLWTITNGTTSTPVLTYAGPPIPVGGHVDLVGKVADVADVAGGDLAATVVVSGSDIASPVSGLYGAPNASAAATTAFNAQADPGYVFISSTYSGSNGSSFPTDLALRAQYPAYYENHDIGTP